MSSVEVADWGGQLMPYQVRDVLLIATQYDSFILEEDGHFSDNLVSQYRELYLSSPPRMTRVTSAQEALVLLEHRQFDLVIITPRVSGMDPGKLANRIKIYFPQMPIVMLTYDTAFRDVPSELLEGSLLESIFFWTGDNRMLLALIKSVEDSQNVAHDTVEGRVRVVLVVEDSPAFYSGFLPVLYGEIMAQTQSLIEEGLNYIDRLRRMRTRPKILLARNFEEAVDLYHKHREFLLGVISDVSFPRNGEQDKKAGIRLLSKIRGESPDLPLLLQSVERENRKRAAEINTGFIDKNSPDLEVQIREFIRNNFGFGDFVFRLPDGTELARAVNLEELAEQVSLIEDASIIYHGISNHFSNWLIARGEFELSDEFRAKKVDEFSSSKKLRDYLVASIKDCLEKRQRGNIADYSGQGVVPASEFVKVGEGSMGGKGRSVAFLYSLLNHSKFNNLYPQVRIRVPPTAVLCTAEFDRFIEDNNLREVITSGLGDEEIAKKFLRGRLSPELRSTIRSLLKEVRYPIAVRSSSLLEDSQFLPFAGIYSTYMLPNNHEDLRVRLEQVLQAIKLVYASTYFQGAVAYTRRMHRRIDEEKMGVVVQRLVGSQHGGRFYPTFSGVAQSYNYYPIRYMKPEDGIATVALGLGRTVVSGGKALRFSPAHPHILPQMSTITDALRNSQRYFYAVNINSQPTSLSVNEEETLSRPDLSAALTDGVLQHVGATFVPSEDRIYDSVYKEGPRVVNFASILKHETFPLASLLSDILKLGEQSMGCPVEVEFAVNLEDAREKPPEFSVLQMRPLMTSDTLNPVEESELDDAGNWLTSRRALGNGVLKDLYDIVYIPPSRFDRRKTVQMAEEVARVNFKMMQEHRPYILLGPGRWGTSDRFLGVPVSWSQVSAARVIIETAIPGFHVDPSQGTHFFHNITSLRVGYLSVDSKQDKEKIDWDWVESQSHVKDLKFVKQVRTSLPITVKLDGVSGRGYITTGHGEDG